MSRKTNSITVFVRAILFFSVLFIVMVLFELSRSVFPERNIVSFIRAGIAVGIIIALWEGIKRINIGSNKD